MIAALRGQVLSISNGELVIDVNGVGYLVSVSPSTLAKVSQVGVDISLIIHTDVRESDIVLFGFETRLEKEVFLMLKRVKGIGSKSALAIVSHLEASRILQCIGASDVAAIQAVPGIGKKTAERIIVELRENVAELLVPITGLQIEKESVIRLRGATATEKAEDFAVIDAISALEKLGFSSERARKAVAMSIEQFGNESRGRIVDASELLKASLAFV